MQNKRFQRDDTVIISYRHTVFPEYPEGGYIYVDKTSYIHRLVTTGKYYFLSRPRRFGKSLLMSTIEEFFKGQRDLFEGLAISDYDYDWAEYPVLHLDLSGFIVESRESLYIHLEDFFRDGRRDFQLFRIGMSRQVSDSSR